MLPTQLKQRTKLIDQVSTYLAEKGFYHSLFPSPTSALLLSTISLDTFKPSFIDTWHGELSIPLPNGKTTKIDLLIQIIDWNFVSLPEVYIKGPLCTELQQLIGLAHFLPMPFYNPLVAKDKNSQYYLKCCYSLHNEISLPRKNPIVIFEWLLEQCIKLFNESLIDVNSRNDDIRRDLTIMWEQLSDILHFSEIDFNYSRRAELDNLFIKINNNFKKSEANQPTEELTEQENNLQQHFNTYVLSAYSYVHLIESSTIKYESFNSVVPWKNKEKNTYQKIKTNFLVLKSTSKNESLPSLSIFSKRIFDYQARVHESKNHIVSQDVPILRLIDLIFWLRIWQRSSLKLWKDLFYELFRRSDVDVKTEFFCCLLIDGIPLSFCITLTKPLQQYSKYRDISKEINLLGVTSDLGEINSSSLLAQIGLVPASTINTTAEFIFNRNIKAMKQENLSCRTIVVVGTGAIGGYLAHNLARLGAGSESGELILIDPDDLSADNIGRHILGKNYIGRPKVEALKDQLQSDLPHLNIKTFKNTIEQFIGKKLHGFDLTDADIIFDATAKPSIGELLSEWRLNLDYPQPCLIHIWIRDNGECVQGLLNEPSKKSESLYACRSCLQNAGGVFGTEYDALVGNTPKHAYAACSDFTPYSVSASMSAAALGTDIVLDYVNNMTTPRYRTRYSERWQGNKIISSDAIKATDCPCCSTRQ
ncbi:hypothetical protein E0H86_04095 [Acinetobacter sp. ANC 4635]|uniref:ThiF family adenylyltransferase n=1 Tax=Acinetobacter sp. ANC 4635 TaxID=2529846 RepID=UPI00103911E7|nr:ThiF family adenylyltransferase [Acinetobacter sp. ANC 4635]TCB32647.1 hypothetical protein E0H86_04095 [Acinetobacter sp. ANC 4635]